ncbi:MAG: DNA-binding protein WhiA [Clostridia bacterium]|nr:DNA-binding protein WhiA [Lachnospiraceae bacterium]NCC01004.1 DNA-binding protein WhiA [Clostridia bacterium]NCD02906.1 DNA-binding protein WhiA [Clostridia bacterium]
MSFSSRVKEELAYQTGAAMHCRIAETAAILSLCGKITKDELERISIKVHTENLSVARKYFTLLKKTYNIECNVCVRSHMHTGKSRTYILEVRDDTAARKVLASVKMMNDGEEFAADYTKVDPLILRKACCKRAFLRGAFLCAGSISEPEKTYHFEIVCTSFERAQQICDMMKVFNIDGKWILRKKYHVVYIKEASQIVDILNVMEAHVSLMELENIRILKEMRNSVNRRVNCETANISKTVSAAVKQIEDITYIRDTVGFGELTDGLREIAQLRLEYPEASLVELGNLLSIPVGKSGVNHRLRKLSFLADELRTRG